MGEIYSLAGHSCPTSALNRAPAGKRAPVVNEPDEAYFRRRSGEERECADRAADACSKAAHLTLAERYAGLAAAIREAQDKLG